MKNKKLILKTATLLFVVGLMASNVTMKQSHSKNEVTLSGLMIAAAECVEQGSYNNGHCREASGGEGECVEDYFWEKTNCFRTP